MRKYKTAVAALTLIALAPWRADAAARQPQSKCSRIKSSPAESGLQSYRLGRIEGQAVYAAPSQKWETAPGGGVCVNLFKRKNGEPVAGVTTDDKGQFEFAHVAPGEYTLVAAAGALQRISIHVQLVAAAKIKRPRRLLLHLREQEDGRSSYVTPVTRPALREELLVMFGQDQAVRNEMIKSGSGDPDGAVLARMAEVDARHTARMKSIIKEHGWPKAGLVGWDGTEAAFILVQHADHAFQKKLLPLMQKEYKAGGLSGPNYALFLDRVLAWDGKPQVYGSQAKPFGEWEQGEPVLYPIEDEANVDKRRAEVGLSPLAEYKQTLKQMYFPKGK